MPSRWATELFAQADRRDVLRYPDTGRSNGRLAHMQMRWKR